MKNRSLLLLISAQNSLGQKFSPTAFGYAPAPVGTPGLANPNEIVPYSAFPFSIFIPGVDRSHIGLGYPQIAPLPIPTPALAPPASSANPILLNFGPIANPIPVPIGPVGTPLPIAPLSLSDIAMLHGSVNVGDAELAADISVVGGGLVKRSLAGNDLDGTEDSSVFLTSSGISARDAFWCGLFMFYFVL